MLVTRRSRTRELHRVDSVAANGLPTRCIPGDPAKGVTDVLYEGPPEFVLPQGYEITTSNRSDERKKY